MALVKCKDCGAEVSTDAKACPKCGARMRPFPVFRAILVVILAIVGVWSYFAIRDYERASDRAQHGGR